MSTSSVSDSEDQGERLIEMLALPILALHCAIYRPMAGKRG
jgi:hypothetical protein